VPKRDNISVFIGQPAYLPTEMCDKTEINEIFLTNDEGNIHPVSLIYLIILQHALNN
jgi:hypothetical protein